MRTITIIILSVIAFVGSCKPEEETTLQFRYINNSDVSIKFENYFEDQTSLNILPGEENSYMHHHRGASSSFPIRLFYFASDSFIVNFNDTLRIVHLSQRLSNDSLVYQGRNEVVLYNYSRSIYNLDSYARTNPVGNLYEAKYTFTQEDMEYAISVYE